MHDHLQANSCTTLEWSRMIRTLWIQPLMIWRLIQILPSRYIQACDGSIASSLAGTGLYDSLDSARQMHRTVTPSTQYGDVLRTVKHHLGPGRTHTSATMSHSKITSRWCHDGIWCWLRRHVYDLYVSRPILWLIRATVGPLQGWPHETPNQRPKLLQNKWTSIPYLNGTGITSGKDTRLRNARSWRLVNQVGCYHRIDHHGS